MSVCYKVLEACNLFSAYAFEEIESKINAAARDGFRLNRPLQFLTEDKGPNEQAVYRVVAVMTRKENGTKPFKASKEPEESKAPKEPKPSKTPKEPKKSKAPKESKKSKKQKKKPKDIL